MNPYFILALSGLLLLIRPEIASAGKILVVNDVQTSFLEKLSETDRKELVSSVLREIDCAQNKNTPVVWVQLTSDLYPTGPIEPSLLTRADRNSIFVSKNEINDGSQCIYEALARKKIIPDEIEICGLNTAFCIKETVNGLASNPMTQRVLVLADACRDAHGAGYHEASLQCLQYRDKVSIESDQSPMERPVHPVLEPFLDLGRYLAKFGSDELSHLPSRSDLEWVNLLFEAKPEVREAATHILSNMNWRTAEVVQTLLYPLLAVVEAQEEKSLPAALEVLALATRFAPIARGSKLERNLAHGLLQCTRCISGDSSQIRSASLQILSRIELPEQGQFQIILTKLTQNPDLVHKYGSQLNSFARHTALLQTTQSPKPIIEKLQLLLQELSILEEEQRETQDN